LPSNPSWCPPQLLEDDYLPNVERIAAALRGAMDD